MHLFIIIIIVVFVNLISVSTFKRFDFSKNKMYSLSNTSKETMKKLDDRVVVKAYFSENLPPQYADAKRYTEDLLSEYQAYSKGHLKFEFIDPGKEEELKKEALKNRIQPARLQINENDKLEVREVYMGLAFMYRGKTETIPLVQKTVGLEYDITLSIKKLISDNQNTIALFKPEDITRNPFGQQRDNYSTFNSIASESYKIQPTDLNAPVPEDVKGMVFTGLKDSLNIQQLHNLDQFIMRGGAVVFFQDKIQANIQNQQAQVIPTNLFDMLAHYGIKIKDNLVADANCGQVNIAQRRGFFSMQTPVNYPFINVITNFNSDNEIVQNIDVMSLVFASEIDSENIPENITFSELFSSSKNTKRVLAPRFDINVNSYLNKDLNKMLTEDPAVLAGLYSGSFKSFFVNDPNFTNNINESQPTNIIFIADSDIILDSAGAGNTTNMQFVLNTLDFISGDSSLIQLRSRGTEYRPLKKISPTMKKIVKWSNILLPSFLLLIFGLIYFKMYNNRKKLIESMYK